MAQVQMPITDKAIGRLGNAVFYMRYGKIFMRSLPFQHKDPKTPAQLKQRLKFSLVYDLFKYISIFTRMGFPESASFMSHVHAFMKANMKTATAGTYPDMTIDFPSLIVSRGTLCRTVGFNVTAKNKQKINIEWMDNSGNENASSTDRAMVLLINPANRQIVMDTKSNSRGDQRIQLEVPNDWENKEIHAYLTFRSAKGDKTAESTYLGAIKINGQNAPDEIEDKDASLCQKASSEVLLTSAEEKPEIAFIPVHENKNKKTIQNIKINYIEETSSGTIRTTVLNFANIFNYEVSTTISIIEKKPEPIVIAKDKEKENRLSEIISWKELMEI